VLCVLLFHTLSNNSLNPLYAAVCPAAQDLANVGAVVGFLPLALVAAHRAQLPDARRVALTAFALYAAGLSVLLWGVVAGLPAALCAGSFAANCAAAWMRVIALVGLAALPLESCTSCVATAAIVFYLVKAGVLALPQSWGLAVWALAAPAGMAAVLGIASQVFRAGREGATAPADLAVTEPRSFVPFTHALFVTVLVFNVACGFSVTFNAVDGAPSSSIAAMVPVVAVALWLVATRSVHADAAYRVACLFVVAGFLGVLLPGLTSTVWPNTLMASGINIFKIVMFVSLATLGRRSPAQTVAVFAWGEAATYVGIELGNLLGRCGGAAGELGLAYLAAAVVLGFFAYNLFMLRTFSFQATVEGVQAPSAVVVASGGALGADRLDGRVERLARDLGLTAREAEVLGLLARGRNVPFIEEALCISRNTVKTHIRHIYAKADLHSQQELIDLVEGGE
jgi:DNA-binding CsgD family transcriptional regulator